jgi:hypothetical protein
MISRELEAMRFRLLVPTLATAGSVLLDCVLGFGCL